MWERVLQFAERTGAVLLLAVVIIFVVDVATRYAVGTTFSFIVELEWYLTSVAVCLGIAPTLAGDAHVRVDILRQRMRERNRDAVDRVGHLLLLVPWCAFVVYAAGRYTYGSYLVAEGSPDPGGLPYRYAVKAFIVIGFAMLATVGLSLALRRPPRDG